MVDNRGFLSLIKNFSSLTREEADELIHLQQDYPYSQVIHHLAARAAHDQQLADREHQLHQSAIYATDRAVLKWVMTAPATPRIKIDLPIQPEQQERETIAESLEPLHQTANPNLVETEIKVPIEVEAAYHEITLEEVEADLARLKELQLDFEARFGTDGSPVIRPVIAIPTPRQEPQPVIRKIETPQVTEPQMPVPEPVAPPVERLLNDIQTRKKKAVNETHRQKEQDEIIEQFIKTKPTMPRPQREKEIEATDLSTDSLHHFGESVISETLVEVLLKQGKRDKAIEVLKKLIWKFPQKKAYFAAQIEDLKK